MAGGFGRARGGVGRGRWRCSVRGPMMVCNDGMVQRWAQVWFDMEVVQGWRASVVGLGMVCSGGRPTRGRIQRWAQGWCDSVVRP